MSLGIVVSEPFGPGFNAYVDGITSQWRWDPTPQTELSTTVVVAFDEAWTAAQANAAWIAVNRWSQFSNLNFSEPFFGGPLIDPEDFAEIVMHLTVGDNIGGFGGYSGTPGEALSLTIQNVNGDSVLVGNTGQVHTYIASDGNLNGAVSFDTSGNLTAAGFELVMHEVGHALGLKHPHDFGAIVNASLFPGVTFGDGNDLGDNNLNQQLYTVMSYNPVQGLGGGDSSTPMAFDIAAIQHMYGARTGVNGGDDSYFLPDPNNATTWSCIWDTGGTDQIAYGGAANAVIDLRPATLDNSPTGGGMPSYTQSGTTYGHGFTIAGDFTNAIPDQSRVAGVIIENASGGSGSDLLTGNDVANQLTGNSGNDTIRGNRGRDTLNGGLGFDLLEGGLGDDIYYVDTDFDRVREAVGSGFDSVFALATFTLHSTLAEVEILQTTDNAGTASINLTGSNFNNRIIGNAAANILNGRDGDDMLKSLNGADTVLGGEGKDLIIGGKGGDLLNGQAGRDTLTGGGDSDRFVFAPGSGKDRIADFEDTLDQIDLTAFGFGSVAQARLFASNVGGNVNFAFASGEQLIVENITKGQLTAFDILI